MPIKVRFGGPLTPFVWGGLCWGEKLSGGVLQFTHALRTICPSLRAQKNPPI